MRKVKNANIALVIIMLMFILTGCGCKHEYESSITMKPTCLENGEIKYTCSKCGKSYTETLSKSGSHSYTSRVTKEPTVSSTGTRTYTCSVCGDSYNETIDKINSNWTEEYIVDSFGDKTNDSVVRGEFHGSFSNSATSGSSLTVYVFIYQPENVIFFRLVEYGSHRATFLSSQGITLQTKDSSGKVKEYYLVNTGDDPATNPTKYKEILNDIKNNKELSMVITANSKYQSIPDKYNFKINNIGLSDLLK